MENRRPLWEICCCCFFAPPVIKDPVLETITFHVDKIERPIVGPYTYRPSDLKDLFLTLLVSTTMANEMCTIVASYLIEPELPIPAKHVQELDIDRQKIIAEENYMKYLFSHYPCYSGLSAFN